MYLTLFLLLVFNKVFKGSRSLVVLLLAISSRVFLLILVKLFTIVYIRIRQGAPLGLAIEMNLFVFNFGLVNSHN